MAHVDDLVQDENNDEVSPRVQEILRRSRELCEKAEELIRTLPPGTVKVRKPMSEAEYALLRVVSTPSSYAEWLFGIKLTPAQIRQLNEEDA